MSLKKLLSPLCVTLSGPLRTGGGYSFPGTAAAAFKRSSLLFLLYNIICLSSIGQSKWVFENYNYIRQPDAAVFVPMIHLETSNNWYMELRYNYEEAETVSLFGGKIFTGGNELEYSIIPMAGISAGRFSGVSVATTTEATWKKFYVWAQSQYSIATKKTATDFFFNWSELGYNISDRFFGGLAMQYTHQSKENSVEPGFVAGLNLKNVSFPVYVFSPFNTGCYFVVGLNYEYSLKKKTTNKSLSF